jgi:hypothetical protein
MTPRAASKDPAMSRASRLRSHLAALVCIGASIAAAPTLAQSSACEEGQKYFAERVSILQQINKLVGKNKQIDPRAACPVFGKMVANGEAGVKWLDANKAWCQVPDQIAEGFSKETESMKKLRTQACQAAAKAAAMEKQAREQQGGGPLGGGGLSGEYKIPQGAL